MSVLYHSGVPDLKPGDIIEPGHSRDNYDDCPICRARREKGVSAIEGTGHPEQVYCTRYRDYAALYASIYGKGDVYLSGRNAPPADAEVEAVAKKLMWWASEPFWEDDMPSEDCFWNQAESEVRADYIRDSRIMLEIARKTVNE